MKILKKFKQGVTCYQIYAGLGNMPWMETLHVTGPASENKYGGCLLLPYKHYNKYAGKLLDDQLALLDRSIGARDGWNGYNRHRLFFSKKKALAYLELAKLFNEQWRGDKSKQQFS